MTSGKWTIARLGFCVSASLFGGCTSTVTVPASELPQLSTQTVRASSEWPTVHAFEGERIPIVGPIERIDIHSAQSTVPLYPRFAARIHGPYLEVTSASGMRGISLEGNPTITIQYENLTRKRNILGSILIVAGAPFLMGGGVFIVNAARNRDAIFEGSLERTSSLFIGIPFAAAGLGLAIPGIIFVATNPKKRAHVSAALQPRLQVGPGGVGMMMAF